MNESERLIMLEKEIEGLKTQLNASYKIGPVCKPWDEVHFYIATETSKRKTPRTREFWSFYEAVRGAVKASMNLSNVRNLNESQVLLALKRAEQIIKAMETALF